MPELVGIEMPPLPPELVDSITAAPWSDLGEGPTSAPLSKWIEAHPQLGFERPPDDRSMADACRSAMWLLAGDLHRSHHLSQSIASAEGSYWHGVMHRREGDFSNAKYWFRRVGKHPVLQQIAAAAEPSLRNRSKCFGAAGLEPVALVDACQQAVRDGGEAVDRCRQIQWLEWQAWFAHCVVSAWERPA